MLVGEWCALAEREGAAGVDAMRALQQAMTGAAAALARSGQVRRCDVDDLAQDATADIVLDRGRALARADAECRLEAWCRGVVSNYARRLYASSRSTRALVDGLDAPAPDAPDQSAIAAIVRDRANLDARLDASGATEAQRAIYDLRIHQGLSFGEIARRLRRSPKTVWERWQGLQRRMVAPPAAQPSKQWTTDAIRVAAARGDTRSVRVFALHADGRTHAEIAEATGLTAGGVKVKIHRARRALS